MNDIYLIGNAHLDPVWLWQWQEGFAEIKATFRSALNRMKEFPAFCFTSACAAYYMWIEQSDPAMFREIQQRVAEGRWGLAGGWLLQPDCNLPCGESFARHALISQRYFKEKFGQIAYTGYNVDSFGHNGNLPMILRQSGMSRYVFMRPMPHEKALPQHLFRWRSRDGSEVLTYRIPQFYNIDESRFEVFGQVAQLDEGTGQMAFYGVGNHGGGATVELLQRMAKELPESSRYATPDVFFAAQETDSLPVVTDDLQFHAKGCYSACSEIKADNRTAENALLTAERLTVLSRAAVGTAAPFDEWHRAWKNVLFNQFHDILGGCAVVDAYADARRFHGEALAIADRTANFAAQQISWQIDTIGCRLSGDRVTEADAEQIGVPAVVFNPHAFPVTAPVAVRRFGGTFARVTDDEGHAVASQTVRDTKTNGANDKYATLFLASVPPLGWRVYHLHDVGEAPSAFPFIITENGIANAKWQLTFDPVTGDLRCLRDRVTGKTLISGSAVRLFDDTKYDTWAHGADRFDDEVPCAVTGTVKVIEQGPVRATMRATQCFGGSTLIRDYSLTAEGDGVTVKTTVDFHEKHRILTFEYTASVPGDVTAMIPFGSMARPTDGTEQPFGDWIRSGSMGLAVCGKHSFCADGDRLRLTVLRSAIYADHYGERDEFCPFMEQGTHVFAYELFAFAGDGDACRRAALLGQPPVTVKETFHRGPLPERFGGMTVSAANVCVTAVKPWEDGDGVIMRAYETDDRDTDAHFEVLGTAFDAHFPHSGVKTFLLRGQKVTETDFMEWEANA